MNVDKAGVDDIDALVKLRVDYLLEDHGSLSEDDLKMIQKDLPDYYQAHLEGV